MTTPSSDSSPERMLRMAFWSGKPPAYTAWRKAIRRPDLAHDAVLIRQSFKHLPMPWLYEELGEDALIRHWPEIREVLDDPTDAMAMQKRQAWDTLWASHALGDAQYPVSKKVVALVHRRKTLQRLRQIIAQPGISIYGLAKSEATEDSRKRNALYSRIYRNVRELEAEGLVEVRMEITDAGRTVCRLIPRESVNAALWERARRQVVATPKDQSK